MKLACLFSGGKDSIYAIYIAQQYGWDVDYLISMVSKNPDSYMFHTPNTRHNRLLAEALGINIIEKKTRGEKEKELLDLEEVLGTLDIDGVISGAIASEYQKIRIDKVCNNLGIKSFVPLWRKNQKQLLFDIINADFEIIIVGVFAYGFNEEWLGRQIDNKCLEDIISLNKKYKINICGEGGEFETIVLNCPLFKNGLEIIDSEKIWSSNSGLVKINVLEFEN